MLKTDVSVLFIPRGRCKGFGVRKSIVIMFVFLDVLTRFQVTVAYH
jgi:hypothetical protein